ncbi:MAG: DUF1553 domain-containing protein [Planctomycetaceae bacterium]|nr:DUF1553 domain-containing protein [Planctomycetaceae bacterium]
MPSELLIPPAAAAENETTAAQAAPPDFSRDIRPILSEYCFACHGPDAAARKADLRLDEREAALDYGAIVPGEAAASPLVERILSDDPDLVMPPPRSKKQLSAAQKNLLRQWVAAGAKYEAHWAFQPVGQVKVPAVKNEAWVQTPIDRFILHRLEQEQVTPSPRAGKTRLIRRLSFDLTGLPPTLAEIEAYLADESPEATAKVVDRLLKSEHYGERMAADWLDVARYSDTYGYQVDRNRNVWPWRDWVIRAFNRNLPYDQFVTEQIAGDLLPDATDDQILATTFNRLHPQKVEGGSTPEEFRIEYVADRTQTVAAGFLGLTLECARCHDHKFDPISQKEYYQLTAFFDKIDEAGLYSFFTPAVPTPTLSLASDTVKAKLHELDTQIAAAEQQLKQLTEPQEQAFATWLAGSREIPQPTAAKAEDAAADEAGENKAGEKKAEEKKPAEPVPQLAGGLIPGEVLHRDFATAPGNARAVEGPAGPAIELTGDDAISTQVGNFRRFEPFTYSLWLKTPQLFERAVVLHRSRAWTDSGSRGYQLLIEDGKLSASIIHFWPGNAIRIRTAEAIPINQWLHVTVTYDGSSRAAGLTLWLDGQPADCEVVRDQLTRQITGGGGDHIALGARFRDRGFTKGQIDELRVFNRELTAPEVAWLHDGSSLQEILDTPADKLTEELRGQLRQYWQAAIDETAQAQRAALKSLREQRCTTFDGLTEIMVMRDMATPRQTWVLDRGAYDARTEPVSAATPAVFPPFPTEAPRNRLGLARWLTDPRHPLTARVAVNRYWQMLFGRGLVRTPEDFGLQGEPPDHPELLDWLARDFMDHGWDVRRLLRMIVLSSVYQQESDVTPAQLARDPENRLLARMSAFRLPAEMLRDQALATSGLLVRTIGGAPARPYELEASFKPIGREKGNGLYRRSVYTFWKRTAPAPVMMSLDASKRDVCQVRRERTSSPLQALVMLNGPQFVEAARVLAATLVEQHGEDADAALADLFRRLTSRLPGEEESAILRELFDRQLARFQAAPATAKQYLTNGDAPLKETLDLPRTAALAVVASTLMNYDETVIRR